MIIPIIKRFKDLAYKDYLASLEEAKVAEDEDLVIVEDIAEECDICNDEQELRDYIRNSSILRQIKYITVHTTATHQNATVAAIINYWKNKLKWSNPGYHIIFPKEGFSVIAEFDQVCNGVKGYNMSSIHLSYIGGIDDKGKPLDNRTESQKRLMHIAIEELLKLCPEAIVKGHREFPKVTKACPCFEVENNQEFKQFSK